MIFEHFALNVNEPHDMKDWYCKHLGLRVVSEQTDPPYMMFLADSSNRVVCELYHRPDEEITDFSKRHPLTFHFAFESDDAEADKSRLMDAGATFTEEKRPNEGSLLVMLRDPWGLSLQICQRSKKLI